MLTQEIRILIENEKLERWIDLAALVVEEDDPKTFGDLVSQINQLLTEKQNQLNRAATHLNPNQSAIATLLSKYGKVAETS